MLNGLLITYYFYPCNNVASLRPYSWFNHFEEAGINLTVVTRHWNGDEKSALDFHKSINRPKEIIENKNRSIHYLPYINSPINKSRSTTRVQQIKDTLEFVFGSREIQDLHDNFYEECANIINTKKIDFIITTAGPFTLLTLVNKLNKQFEIPYIVDFRDLWSLSEQIKGKVEIGILTHIQNYFLRKKISKWISKALGVSSVNNELGFHLLKRLNCIDMNYFSIYNGYEKELFKGISKRQATKFTFSVIGTIYPEQNIQIAIDAIRMFIKKYSLNEDFQFNFIGTAVYSELKNKIENQLNYSSVIITERVPREQALSIMVNSHILFHCGWPAHIGISSGKIYEYIAAGPSVLIAPNDFGVMEKIISETGSGFVANSSEEMLTVLEMEYKNWQKQLPNGLSRNNNKIEVYTRENQAKLYAYKIKEWLT